MYCDKCEACGKYLYQLNMKVRNYRYNSRSVGEKIESSVERAEFLTNCAKRASFFPLKTITLVSKHWLVHVYDFIYMTNRKVIKL